MTRTLSADSRVGDFVTFLSTNTGFGNVTYKQGKVSYGMIPVEHVHIATGTKNR